jgi:hypothetical protein
MGPSVVARNALQQRVWLRPPFEEPGLAGGVTALLDVDVRPGRFPEWGLAVLAVRGPLRSFRWDGEAQRFEPAGWPWEELTLRGVLRELGPGELAVGDVRLRASWSPGALDRARGAFAQVRLAPAAAPADGDGDGDDGRTWRVRDAVPAQPLLVREDSGSWRLAASAPRGVGLLLVSRERALEPFAVGGALLLDAPTVLTLAPDPSGGLYLPDAVLRDWRGGFAQVLLSTPGGPVLSERVGL